MTNNEEKIYTGKKVVDIHSDSICYAPFFGPFKGSLFRQVVSTGSIRYLLGRGATVYEILSSGEKVKLDYSNYNKWLDEGDIPPPGYEPVIPPEETEDETDGGGDDTTGGEDTKPDPETEEPGGDTEEPITGDEESGEAGLDSITPSGEEDILDIPDGLTPEEEDEWLEKHM